MDSQVNLYKFLVVEHRAPRPRPAQLLYEWFNKAIEVTLIKARRRYTLARNNKFK